MVEQTLELDMIFRSLSDSTRRDILKQVAKKEQSIGDLAHSYNLTFAGVAKHISVLQSAGLIQKRREGKQQIVTIVPKAIITANKYLKQYEKMWESRFDALDDLLRSKKRK